MRIELKKWVNKNVRFQGLVTKVDDYDGDYVMLTDVKVIAYTSSLCDEENLVSLDHIWLFEKQVKPIDQCKVEYRVPDATSVISKTPLGVVISGVGVVSKYTRRNGTEDIGIKIHRTPVLSEVINISKKWSYERKHAYFIDILEKLKMHTLHFDMSMSAEDAKSVISSYIEEVKFQMAERDKRATAPKGAITSDPVIPKTKQSKIKGFG